MEHHRQSLWHNQTAAKAISTLDSPPEGLNEQEALRRSEKYGPNQLLAKRDKSLGQMIKDQIFDPMILILIGAALFSALLGEVIEASVILTIVILNALIGIVQEKKAQSSLAALKNLSTPMANVIRNGHEQKIPAQNLTLGDRIVLHDGDKVPADLRLIETANLRIQESALTGEAAAIYKNSDLVLAKDCPLGDRLNMAFASSIVTYGRGIGIVTAIGNHTEVGQIADLIEKQTDFETPLKKKLNSVGQRLTLVGIIICLSIFIIGALYGRPLLPQFLVAISLAISIIPEGLPATASIVMALGVKRMAKKKALIKKLPAVETLGNATVICSDKTGTLTLNQMTVTEVATDQHLLDESSKEPTQLKQQLADEALILAATLCNDATINDKQKISGDPTEAALLPLADQLNKNVQQIKITYPRVFEIPFDSNKKRMTTVNQVGQNYIAYTKGAIDQLLPHCTYIQTNQGVREICFNDIKHILNLSHKMATNSLRVLGFAQKTVTNFKEKELTTGLTFIGLTGMIDPPRPEVASAVQTCRQAGIKTIMITGDHQITAMAIAKKLNIYQDGDKIFTGQELDKMSNTELDAIVKKTSVFARVSPKDKLRIIESLKRNQEVVAMTGDGANDSPALKAADIGIAMGQSGTDVAKDVADMILLDDSFATIVAAIKEGRRVYRNLQKIIQFLLVGNIAEISTLAIATIFNWNTPLLAIHILWINLATATLPALALGIDAASPNIMKHQPVKTGTLFEKELVIQVISQGLFVALLTLTAYGIGSTMTNQAMGQTMAFYVLAFSQMLRSFNQHSNTNPIWKRPTGINYWLVISFMVSASLMTLIFTIPVLRNIFMLTTLSINQWLVVFILSIFSIIQVEIYKSIRKTRTKSTILTAR